MEYEVTEDTGRGIVETGSSKAKSAKLVAVLQDGNITIQDAEKKVELKVRADSALGKRMIDVLEFR